MMLSKRALLYTLVLSLIGVTQLQAAPQAEIKVLTPPVRIATDEVLSTVMFSGVESSGEIVQYDWDFGDPTTSPPEKAIDTGMLSAHSYPAGTFTVTLTVTDQSGATSSTQEVITIAAFSGQTYYVSSSEGNDEWDGLAPEYQGDNRGPWQSAQRALDGMEAPEGEFNQLLMKRGDVWSNERLSMPPGFLSAYGEGPKPLVETDSDDRVLGLGYSKDQQGNNARFVNNIHCLRTTGPRLGNELIEVASIGSTIEQCVVENGGIQCSVNPPEMEALIIQDTQISGAAGSGFYAQYLNGSVMRRCQFSGNGDNNIRSHGAYLNLVQDVLWDDVYIDGQGKDGQQHGNLGLKQNSVINGLFRGLHVTRTRNGVEGLNNDEENKPANKNVIIEDSFFHDIGYEEQSYAVLVKNVESLTIRNSLFSDINPQPRYGDSVINLRNRRPNSTVRILNNTFYSNHLPDIRHYGAEEVENFDLIEIKGNVFMRNGEPTEDNCYFELSELGLLDKIDSDGNAFYWVGLDEDALVMAIDNSNDQMTDSFNTWQDRGQDPNSLWAAPNFVDASNHNFRLQNNSPLIDQGLSHPLVFDDFDDLSRPVGIKSDIGAHEYGSGSFDFGFSTPDCAGNSPVLTWQGETKSGSEVTVRADRAPGNAFGYLIVATTANFEMKDEEGLYLDLSKPFSLVRFRSNHEGIASITDELPDSLKGGTLYMQAVFFNKKRHCPGNKMSVSNVVGVLNIE